jgi:hypothetical protein
MVRMASFVSLRARLPLRHPGPVRGDGGGGGGGGGRPGRRSRVPAVDAGVPDLARHPVELEDVVVGERQLEGLGERVLALDGGLDPRLVLGPVWWLAGLAGGGPSGVALAPGSMAEGGREEERMGGGGGR